MPRVTMHKTARIRMLRSVVTADETPFYVGGVYDIPAKLAESWVAYGVCESADDAELHDDPLEDDSPVRLVHPDGRVEA